MAKQKERVTLDLQNLFLFGVMDLGQLLFLDCNLKILVLSWQTLNRVSRSEMTLAVLALTEFGYIKLPNPGYILFGSIIRKNFNVEKTPV